ncbi:MAG TPA: TolC family protein [Blastocatellia bacterium]|nr:TolC family protein [Blastocatellia bacterium]
MKRTLWLLSCCLLLLTFNRTSLAQTPSPPPITLEKAVDTALTNYPEIRAARAREDAARAGIEVAKTSYLPRTDLLWQENRATSNNVFGLLLPQSIIPPISGPVLGTKSFDSVWGSAGGLLFSWEPMDFGFRKATVDLARATANQAAAGVDVTRLDAATSAADGFLGLIASEQAARAAQANVERFETFAKAVHVLVDNQLRAGADASRADAELAAARIQLIQSQQAVDINRANLARALGLAGDTVTVDAGPLLDSPPDTGVSPPNFDTHPLALQQSATVDIIRARERILDRSYFPRFNFQSAFFGRGTGLPFNGQTDTTNGLLPETPNWAAGISVTFQLFDLFSIRAKRRAEASNELAEKARYEQTVQNLKAQDARARAFMDSALRIAANTPVQLKAAQESALRARARYDAQLATVTDVAEAQRLLAQAEIDDAVARLGVWRALLAGAAVQGDIKPFIQQVTTAPVQRRK